MKCRTVISWLSLGKRSCEMGAKTDVIVAIQKKNTSGFPIEAEMKQETKINVLFLPNLS